MAEYAEIVKSAAEVETAKNQIVAYARKCVFLREEPDEAHSKELVETFLAAQDAYHEAMMAQAKVAFDTLVDDDSENTEKEIPASSSTER